VQYLIRIFINLSGLISLTNLLVTIKRKNKISGARTNARNGRGKGSNTGDPTSWFTNLVDRGLAMSDGSAITMQDREEKRNNSSAPPAVIPRNFTRQGHWLKSSTLITTLVSAAAVETPYSTYCQLSQVNNYTNYAAVYDQYCIVAAIFRIRSLQAQSSSSLANPGLLLTCIDHDDAGTLTAAQIREYPSCLETLFTTGQVRVVEPRFAVAAYSGTFASYANMRGYIDCSSPNVQHYGLKTTVTASTYNTSAEFTVDLIIHFRDQH